MKILRNLCLFISILVFMSLCVDAKASHAATYYVATTGNDNNPGTQGSPFRTVGQGTRVLSGGDTLIVRGGTYAEGNLHLPSGSSGAPTTLIAAQNETVTLQPNSSVDCIICFSSGQSWITIDGLILDGGSPGGGSRLVTFPVLDSDNSGLSNTSHLTVQNSEIKNGRHSCFLTSGTAWTLRNNHIHHCGTDTQLDHGVYFQTNRSLIIGNTFDNNACFNLQVYSGHGADLCCNTFIGNVFTSSGCGLVATMGGSHVLYNNVHYADATRGNSAAFLCCGANSKVFNNTIVNNLSRGVLAMNGVDDQGAQFRHNIVCGNSGGQISLQNAATSNNLTTSLALSTRRMATSTSPLTVPRLTLASR
jgi:hypothetical protein